MSITIRRIRLSWDGYETGGYETGGYETGGYNTRAVTGASTVAGPS